MPTTTIENQNNITAQNTLGDLVAGNPKLAKIFEKLGLDFCCGGTQSLADACKEKGIEANTVLAVLQAVEEDSGQDPDEAQQRNWTKESLQSIAQHIVETHHAYLAQELPRLGEMVEKIAKVHGNNHAYLHELHTVFAGFADGMKHHSKEEEKETFPMINSIEKGQWQEEAGKVEQRINKLIEEHQGAGKALEKMRELTDGYATPEDGCGTYRFTMESLERMEADTHQHIHLENSVLFPRAIAKQKEQKQGRLV